MAVYVMVDIEVLDGHQYAAYRQQAPATVAAHGGRYLARGGATEGLEGAGSPQRCVILEFPDMAHGRAWWSSPEHAPLRALRQQSTRTRMVVTQGL